MSQSNRTVSLSVRTFVVFLFLGKQSGELSETEAPVEVKDREVANTGRWPAMAHGFRFFETWSGTVTDDKGQPVVIESGRANVSSRYLIDLEPLTPRHMEEHNINPKDVVATPLRMGWHYTANLWFPREEGDQIVRRSDHEERPAA